METVTGTTDMIADCLAAGLPEPAFEQNGVHFVTTIWRDWLTDAVTDELGLNERQKKVINHLKHRGTITNRQYQDVTDAIVRTAARDLGNLVNIGLLKRIGSNGQNRMIRREVNQADFASRVKTMDMTRALCLCRKRLRALA